MGNLGWRARDGVVLPKDGSRVREPDSDSRAHQDGDRGRICCPCCGWEPGRHDRWACTCLHLWNTFDTGGVCPSCGREWAPRLSFRATPAVTMQRAVSSMLPSSIACVRSLLKTSPLSSTTTFS